MGLFGKHKENNSGVEAPVAPPMPEIKAPEKSEVETSSNSTLSAPSMPGQGIDEIKSQVTANTVAPPAQVEENYNVEQSSDLSLDNENFNIDDSLFDFSDIENSNDQEVSNNLPQISDNTTIDSNSENTPNLNFVNNSKNYTNASREETYFVTTAQFKTLLEIVDSVKERIKNSTDSHLRLLDIKSEEDIEYENLRKDFQFLEDKLYELDTIIFEK